jgi:hypothetical protein
MLARNRASRICRGVTDVRAKLAALVLGKPHRNVRRAANDPRSTVSVGLPSGTDQRFQNQKELFGQHDDVRSRTVRPASSDLVTLLGQYFRLSS